MADVDNTPDANPTLDLNHIRKRIDEIDDGILDLFLQRMQCIHEVSACKKAHKLPILDRKREREKLTYIASQTPAELKSSSLVLFSLLMETARTSEHLQLQASSQSMHTRIDQAQAHTGALFPTDALIACQGVEGAYSQLAADRLFKRPNISFFTTFEGVFNAVDQGFSRYGVIPLENSTAGSVTKVYDLMMRYDFHIVRTLRLKIDHCVLAKPSTKLADVRHIYSHPQAIAQCSAFLDQHKEITVHVCENTAVAAQKVADDPRDCVAALSSRSCAGLYGLVALQKDVQDTDNNYTRFACISKKLEIYPGADHSSLMLVLGHEPGTLYKTLSRFYALDINICKLESRPIPHKNFEFMFYFDIECPVASPQFSILLDTLQDTCEEFRYLGSYAELL
ncbi:bifunctional chorismate mutase/prephenate dehydratase [Atopobium deltae]|uniref:Bifunctional chorismate mutase/prephenate dehydratase n=1 Tax=Atopobium deltae TaxID=1393034 RepID=A0A133XX64_9ACTN|nr:bifunctional chorismate mutase/prephenate dehydratase [Atopobium deltae]KXB35521.1 prephenate dehydratase [Atopobium deltae]